jgi:hypothetical protein
MAAPLLDHRSSAHYLGVLEGENVRLAGIIRRLRLRIRHLEEQLRSLDHEPVPDRVLCDDTGLDEMVDVARSARLRPGPR